MRRVKAAIEVTHIAGDFARNSCIPWSSSCKCTLKCAAENDQNIFSVGKLVRDKYSQSHGFSEYISDGRVDPLMWHCKRRMSEASCTIPVLSCTIVTLFERDAKPDGRAEEFEENIAKDAVSKARTMA
jgi:hypothetical protein